MEQGKQRGILEQNTVGKGIEQRLLRLIQKELEITRSDMAEKLHFSLATIKRTIASLKSEGYLSREGDNRNGSWVVS